MTCQICQSADHKEIGEKNGFKLLECADCGFRFADPMPTPEELTRFYNQYFGNEGYLRKKHSKLRRCGRRLRRIKKLVRGNRFLDVGCNVGFAVEAARLQGFQATGIDLDPESVGLGKQAFPQNHFEVATPDDLAARGLSFDLVYCAEVIEHAPDVQAFAEGLRQAMAPGGILYLTTPDAGHWRTPADFASWAEVKPPEHLCYFNKRTIRRLLADHGIEVIRFGRNMKPGLRVIARRVA